MDLLITEVKGAKRVQNNIEKFESLTLTDKKTKDQSASNTKTPNLILEEIDSRSEPAPLLKAVSSRTTAQKNSIPVLNETLTAAPDQIKSRHQKKDSAIFIQQEYLNNTLQPELADDAREILKCQPSVDDIGAVLTYIQYGIDGQHDFNIKVTGPKSSTLLRVLVTTTIPDIWPSLSVNPDSASRAIIRTLLNSLFSVAGIELLLEQIHVSSRTNVALNTAVLQIYLEVLAMLIKGTETVIRLLQDTTQLYQKDVQRRLFWQGVVALFGGSKVLSTTSVIPRLSETNDTRFSWLLVGADYSRWLANNIVKASTELTLHDTLGWTNLCQIFKRGLGLGYRDGYVANIYSSLLLGRQALWTPLHQLTKSLTSHEQKVVFDSILSDLARKHLVEAQSLSIDSQDTKILGKVAGAAALITGLIEHNEYMLECAIDWVSTSNGSHGNDIATKRALIAALASSRSNLERILEKSLISFSDKLQIQYAPTVQQEHLAQTILLTIGYLHRSHPESLREGQIPNLSMQSVSNRLSSSVPANRLLGMVVGVGISQCVDAPGSHMKFDVEEMDAPEVKELLGLISIQDHIGRLNNLQLPEKTKQQTVPKKRKIIHTQPRKAATKITEQESKILSIEEVSSSSSDDEDDLVPYQKPRFDPEDSDEDPTLLNRDKPKSPIYIVDLIKQLQSPSDKLDIIATALEAGPALIRRKAGFGTELSDNIRSLASSLINLQDGMSKDEQQQQRLDALVGCVYVQPEQMGKYLSSMYFQGDFSLSQRSTLLIAIGLGARELAGFSDTQNAYSNMQAEEIFPSKRLPAHLQPRAIDEKKKNESRTALSGITNPLSMLTDLATRKTIQPMAIAAAKSQTGPEILQVTRTSSRLALAKDKADAKRTSKVPKNVYQILTHHIYLPLASPLSAIFSYTSTTAGSSVNSSLLHSSIVTLHLQTLTLLLHTLGPTGLSPPANYASITHETLSLLVSLHNIQRLCFDGVVLPAMLGLFLALIDVTCEIGVSAQERLLADPFGNRVAELVRWTGGLESGRRAPAPARDGDVGSGNSMPWTVMAAGIQVRWYEMGRKFQSRMLGFDLAD